MTPRPPDRTIEVNAVTLACDDRGSGGTPLVLVHGFSGGRVDWADVIDDLARDRRVVAWDHRGHADSTNTGDAATYTFEQLTQDLFAVVDHLGLERFDLVGHSMGGVVAMRAATEQPARVRSLVLMDTFGAPIDALTPDWIDRFVTLGRSHGMDAVAEKMVAFTTEAPSFVPETRRDAVLGRTRHKLAHMDVEAFDALGQGLLGFPSLLDAIGRFRGPVSVLVGEHDVALRAPAVELAAAIDGAELTVIPDAAHSPQDENPAVWMAAVRAHLHRAVGA